MSSYGIVNSGIPAISISTPDGESRGSMTNAARAKHSAAGAPTTMIVADNVWRRLTTAGDVEALERVVAFNQDMIV